jgi:hypothetical protein
MPTFWNGALSFSNFAAIDQGSVVNLAAGGLPTGFLVFAEAPGALGGICRGN